MSKIMLCNENEKSFRRITLTNRKGCNFANLTVGNNKYEGQIRENEIDVTYSMNLDDAKALRDFLNLLIKQMEKC